MLKILPPISHNFCPRLSRPPFGAQRCCVMILLADRRPFPDYVQKGLICTTTYPSRILFDGQLNVNVMHLSISMQHRYLDLFSDSRRLVIENNAKVLGSACFCDLTIAGCDETRVNITELNAPWKFKAWGCESSCSSSGSRVS